LYFYLWTAYTCWGAKHPKAMQVMLKMKKLDIAELERAVEDQGVPTYR
jgi:hypothetical protein